jgi:hypothetical protein
VDAYSYIQLVFKEFDVFEMDSPSCTKDKLVVTSFNSQGDDEEDKVTIGTFCNTKPPRDTLESRWNVLELMLITNGANSGKGFWATYETLSYTIENGNANNLGKLDGHSKINPILLF